ncbi:gamma-aminobutyraldehyde dehydrogenase [Sinomonas notoginsengisoli]|uniref:aldehyde dehydrogenase family protein n=1 Tax=Sinomonas notoginsengisoli TaxID=1457311 RepID=UPI001F3B6672|nr:aldehyde dehydrogenase family protein [Sinomonas notoginsengisoli]
MNAFHPVNPATLAPLPTLEGASDADVTAAVSTVAEAMDSAWPRDHARRAAAMQRWADLLEHQSEGFRNALIEETGKTAAEAQTEIHGAVDALRFNAGLARLPLGRSGSLPDGSEAHLVREPVGPTVFITPWNWPVLLLLRDLAPAFAAGVTAIVKPATQTANVTSRLIELGHRAGVPREVLVQVNGEAEVGSALVRHPGTRAVAITGSTAAGQAVMRDAAETMTRPLLELGGKATMMVLPDADLPAALERAAQASITTSGQMCMACTRVLVHQDQADYAEHVLRTVLGAMRPGDPRDPKTHLGPLISAAAAEKVEGFVDLARRTGRVSVGGHAVHPQDLPGNFMSPALVTSLDPASPVIQEDIFGPVLSLETFADEAEAVALANGTPFGLAAAVWTGNLSRGLGLARSINAGTVWVNGYNRSYAEMPSGGVRMSGLGRTRGVEGVEQFTELKHIHFSL